MSSRIRARQNRDARHVIRICDTRANGKVTFSGNFLDCVTACAAALYAPDRGHGLNRESISLGTTVLRLCESAVRRRFTGREVTGLDCSFADIQSTDSDRYESERKIDRTTHAVVSNQKDRSSASEDGPP